MLLFDFSNAVNELCDYYERKEPKQGTKDLWFANLKNIPTEALPWIVKKICQENESFPRNLPGAIQAMYQAWRGAHPEKIAHEQKQDCPDCDDGTIRAWKIGNNNRAYSYLFRCARCKQCTTEAWPFAYRGQLIADGYEPEQRDKITGPSTHGTLKKLVEKVVDGAGFDNNVPF